MYTSGELNICGFIESLVISLLFFSSGCGIVIQVISLAFLVSLVYGTCHLPSLFPLHQSNPTISQRLVLHLTAVLNVSGMHTPHRKRKDDFKFSDTSLCVYYCKKVQFYERCTCNPIKCSVMDSDPF